MGRIEQLTIDFSPGLLEQFPLFRECVTASVYGCGRQFKALAADLDYSPSKLSRMLADNPDDPINFPLHRLPDLIEATGDPTPVYWLIERFLEPADHKHERAASLLAQLLPLVQAALNSYQKS